jgi:type 1 glutamine amidotransferase
MSSLHAPSWTGCLALSFVLGLSLASPASCAVTGLVANAADPPAQELLLKDPAAQRKIEEALPTRAFVPPRQPRRLLIFDRNVNYGGHGSIPHANYALVRLGEVTGAFAAVVSRDPAVFAPESLKHFDAVFFNNNVGNLFTDPALRQSLVDFVYGGGGLLGVHGTSVAFTQWPGAKEDWPEFGLMLGARGANHRDSDEYVIIKLDDPTHPLNQPFAGKSFDYRDEFFRVHEPYSRHRVRVLLSIDIDQTDLNQGAARGAAVRADNDYALAWIRNYGRGRVFYCTIAHNPYVFWDPTMLRFYLAAVQFALGDLPAPTTPSAKLTPAIRAQEQLGWRLGLTIPDPPRGTLFEVIDQAASLGLLCLSGASFQPVSTAIPKPLDPSLTDDERQAVRLKLDQAGVRLLAYAVPNMPSDPSAVRNLFEFGRKMGIEIFISTAPISSLDAIDNLCGEYQIRLALRNAASETAPKDWTPTEVLKICQGRSNQIGAWASLSAWLQSGIDPVKAVQTLQRRLLCFQIHEPQARKIDAEPTQRALEEIQRLGFTPALFGIGFALSPEAAPGATQAIAVFNQVSLQLTAELK